MEAARESHLICSPDAFQTAMERGEVLLLPPSPHSTKQEKEKPKKGKVEEEQMSYKITRLVLELNGLTPTEKAVAHCLAYHAKEDGTDSYPSMATIARESGLKDRRSAQRIVRRLEQKSVVLSDDKSGGRFSTRYRFNLEGGDHAVAGGRSIDHGRGDHAVAGGATVQPPERSSKGKNKSQTWLVGRIESHLQDLGIMETTASERVKLGKLEQQYGTLMVLLGFLYFLTERTRGVEGLKYPVSVFAKDSKLWIEIAHKDALEEGCREEDESLIRAICEKYGYPIDAQSLCLLSSLRHEEFMARCSVTREFDSSQAFGLAAVEDFLKSDPVTAKTPVTERAAQPVEVKSLAASVVH
jgi:hypothetical protein